MKNSQRYYERVRGFLNATKEIEDEHAATLNRAERFKGSTAYKEVETEADAKRDAAIKAEREYTGKEIRAIIESMRQTVRSRRISPPSVEQVNVLEVLRMKKNVTADEIKQIANNLKDCPLALSVLLEVAHDHNIIFTGNLVETMSIDRIIEYVDNLERSAFAMLRGETRHNRVPENLSDCLTRFGGFAYKIDRDELGGQHAVINEGRIAEFVRAIDGEVQNGE